MVREKKIEQAQGDFKISRSSTSIGGSEWNQRTMQGNFAFASIGINVDLSW